MTSYTIYEDNIVRVLLEIHPETPGHCLIRYGYWHIKPYNDDIH